MGQVAQKTSLSDWPLGERPGFLVRRLHQIHMALFAEACKAFDITPVQYSLLSALSRHGSTDQTTLSADVVLDRTTATGALKRLEQRGLISRIQSSDDRRARDCKLTVSGSTLLKRIESSARKAHVQTIATLDEVERATFMSLLKKLVASHEI